MDVRRIIEQATIPLLSTAIGAAAVMLLRRPSPAAPPAVEPEASAFAQAWYTVGTLPCTVTYTPAVQLTLDEMFPDAPPSEVNAALGELANLVRSLSQGTTQDARALLYREPQQPLLRALFARTPWITVSLLEAEAELVWLSVTLDDRNGTQFGLRLLATMERTVAGAVDLTGLQFPWQARLASEHLAVQYDELGTDAVPDADES